MQGVDKLRCGILGTGWMLGKYAEAFRLVDGAALVGVASREPDRARAAAVRWGIERAHGSYESLLQDPGIDIVINALHNGLHCEWTIHALQAGKHVLCEKPLGCSADEVARMFDAARANHRRLLEGFMFRFHPQMTEARRHVAAGSIGRVLYIRSSRTAYGRPRDNPRYWSRAGGGALLDLGCYCVNLSRLFAGAEPKRVFAQARFDRTSGGAGEQTGVDLTLSGTLEFDGGVTAQFVCSMEAEPSYPVEVIGTEGKLLIPDPWLPPHWPTELVLSRQKKTETLRVDPRGIQPHVLTPFALEIGHFCACVRENLAPQFPPDCDAEQDSRANARALDALATSARTGRPVPVPSLPSINRG